MSALRFKRNELLLLLTKLKPSDKLMLVGDQGVYIMSFQDQAKPGEDVTSFKRTIVYAQGCNPETDPNFWDKKEELFGGDDGADTIGTAQEFFPHVWKCKDYLTVVLTETHIKIVA